MMIKRSTYAFMCTIQRLECMRRIHDTHVQKWNLLGTHLEESFEANSWIQHEWFEKYLMRPWKYTRLSQARCLTLKIWSHNLQEFYKASPTPDNSRWFSCSKQNPSFQSMSNLSEAGLYLIELRPFSGTAKQNWPTNWQLLRLQKSNAIWNCKVLIKLFSYEHDKPLCWWRRLICKN
jgi:hypothetical protein